MLLLLSVQNADFLTWTFQWAYVDLNPTLLNILLLWEILFRWHSHSGP